MTAREVEPITKESQTRRVWQCPREDAACTRKDPCRSCLGRRNRRSGMRKQREAAKALGVPTARFHGQNGNEENWASAFFCDEVKSGRQVDPIATRFLQYEGQVLQNRRIGDLRAPRVTVMPTGWGQKGIVMLRTDVWRDLVEPALALLAEVAK